MSNHEFDSVFEADSSRRQFLVGSMASFAGVGFLGKLGWKRQPALGREPAAKSGEPIYRIGAGSVDITPNRPMKLMGYGTRDHAGNGSAYHQIYNRVLTIDDGKKTLVYVQVELITTQSISAEKGLVTAIREAMGRRGIPPEQVALVAAHIHNGPELTPEYRDEVGRKTIALIDKCLAEAREGRLYFGRGRCEMAANRRSMDMDGNYLWSLINRYGRHDHEMLLLKAVDLKGKPIALAFNYGCHPITMGGYAFGSDWVGFAIDEVEKQLGAPVMLLQGCAGDQRPDCPDKKDPLAFRSSVTELTEDGKPNEYPETEDAQRMGKWVAGSVVETLRKPLEQISGPIRSSLTRLELPTLVGVKPDTKKPDWKIGSNFTTGDWTNLNAETPFPEQLRGPEHRWLRLAEIVRNSVNPDGTFKATRPAELFVTRIGDRFIHVGLSGEPAAGFSLRIKDQLRGNQVMVTGYTGLAIGYIMTSAQIIEGGYEVFRNGSKGLYSPAAEDVYINTAMKAVRDLA